MRNIRPIIRKSSLLSVAFAVSMLAFANAESVKLGKVEFIAETNVKMFKFTGEAKELQAKVERSGAQLSSLQLSIPVQALKTGMEIRDKHMKERVFTSADGSTPDIVFKANQSACTGNASDDQTCTVQGLLSFRGVEKPYQLVAKLKDGSKVSGSTVIDVLEFGVDPKALMYSGINVNRNVNVNFEVNLQ